MTVYNTDADYSTVDYLCKMHAQARAKALRDDAKDIVSWAIDLTDKHGVVEALTLEAAARDAETEASDLHGDAESIRELSQLDLQRHVVFFRD